MAVYESNGTTIPHATDHDDMLDILVDFLTGVVGSLPSFEQWTVLLDDTTSVAGERFVYFRGPGVPATGILTLTSNALNGETVTIDSKVYTFQTALTDVDGNVLIGATASDSLDNLINAINLGSGSGTTYAASMTLHPTVFASTGPGDSMNVFSKVAAAASNSIGTTETLTGGQWLFSTLTGGLDGRAHVNLRRFTNAPNNVQAWELKGATGFDSAEPYTDQPGISPTYTSHVMTDVTVMPFRIIANGRRFIVITQCVQSFTACYCGFYLSYATPGELPFPIMIGGNSVSTIRGSQETNYTIGNFYDGPISSLQIRHQDGTWVNFGSYAATTNSSRPGINTSAINFPYDSRFSNSYGLGDNDEGGGSASWTLFNILMHTSENGGNDYGEPEGVFFIPPTNGFTNNVVPINGVDYLVIQNTYRALEVNVAFRMI